MQLAFLAPLFAAALAAIVVPLLVHLVHKERKEAISFPSLMFVKRMTYQHASRQRIRDWLLFAARCLIVALLVAAFMRPVVSRTARHASPQAGGTEIGVLLDRSLSMRYAGRWPAAQAAVRARMSAVRRNDRLTLVPFDLRAAAVNDGTAEMVALRAALDSVRPVDAGTRLAPAVALARRVLGASRLPTKELLVVSDFQRSAWDLTDDMQMPSGTKIVPVDVAAGEVVDRSVRAVDVRRDVTASDDRVIVSARLINVGPAVKGLSVRLEVNGRVLQARTVDLPADGGGAVAFDPIPVPADGLPARVILDPDQLPSDDVFYFLLKRAPAIAVLLIDHADASAERTIFASRALAFGDQPAFDVRAVRSTRATAADLAGTRLVLLNDAGLPPAIGAERLLAFVRAGGGLLNVLGEHSGARAWPPGATALLPGAVGAPVDRLGDRGAVLGYLDRSHQALAVFSGARSGDLSAARFFRYRPLDVKQQALARFDDGTVALAEHRVGRGRIVTWGSSFDGVWNDLPRQTVFLPFVQQLAQYAATYRAPRNAMPVGEFVDLSDGAAAGGVAVPDARRASDSAATRFSVRAPGGGRLSVGGADGAPALELREAGWYEVRRSGAPNERPRLLAANPAAAELEFATFDPARLMHVLTAVGDSAAGRGDADPEQRLVDREREQSIWWYLLVVAAIVLLAEGMLASRLSQRRVQSR